MRLEINILFTFSGLAWLIIAFLLNNELLLGFAICLTTFGLLNGQFVKQSSPNNVKIKTEN